MPRRHPCLAPLPAPLGLRFRALLGLGFVPPPEPRPCAHCASIAYALLPAARVPLCRHRADPESSSRSLPSGSSARIAPPIAPAARVPLSRCVGPGPLAGKNRTVCIPFSRRGARNHAWREDVAGAARPFRGSGMRHGRTGFAPCGAGLACLPPAPLPAISLVPAAACAPCHLARVHRRRLIRVALRRPHCIYRAQPSATPPIAVGMSRLSVSSCRPRAAHADASRPSMRARRHCLGPNPRQPSPSPVPTGPQPRANRASFTRGAVCAHPCPATRRASPCRAGPAAVPVIPAKWCGDTIAHTRKLRF